MLAASNPQLFVPFGRQQIKNIRYVASAPQLPNRAFLSMENENSETQLGCTKDEEWIVRINKDDIEEELYISGKTVIWSVGNLDGTLPHYNSEVPSGKLLHRSFTSEHNIKQAFWFTFNEFNPILKPLSNNIETICIVTAQRLYVYGNGIEEYSTHFPFVVSKVWLTKFGLLVERATATALGNTSCSYSTLDHILPTVYCITHPLNEVTPVLSLNREGILSYIKEESMVIVFTSEEYSICMTFDLRYRYHSIWKIRMVTKTEMDSILKSDEMLANSTKNSSTSNVNTCRRSLRILASTSKRTSVKKHSSKRVFTPTFSNMTSVYSRSNNTKLNSWVVDPEGLPLSPLNNSFKNVSKRLGYVASRVSCYSEANSALIASSNKMSSKTMDRIESTSTINKNRTPVKPELCLEHIWTEDKEHRRRNGKMSDVTKVFISSDFTEQKFLCYLKSAKDYLVCTQFECENEFKSQLVFRPSYCVPAKDAAYLPSIQLMVVIDPSLSIMLYSGVMLIGEVIFGGICSAQYLTMALSLSEEQSPMNNSITRNPILSSTRLSEEMFTADENISPVFPKTEHSFSVYKQNNVSNMFSFTAIKDSVGQKVTMKCHDGLLYRVAFPVLTSSPLVSKCIEIFKSVLPRNVILAFLASWYSARNAPGTQNISTEEEWQLFVEILLRLLGYNVNTVPLLKQYDRKILETPIHSKKRRSSNTGTNSDWIHLLNSNYHKKNNSHEFWFLKSMKTLNIEETYEIDSTAQLYPYFYIIYFSLHLFYEESKLKIIPYDTLPMLAPLLYQLASDLKLNHFQNHYWNDFPHFFVHFMKETIINAESLQEHIPNYLKQEVPNIFKHVYYLLNRKISSRPFPYMRKVNEYSVNIIQLVGLFRNQSINYEDLIDDITPFSKLSDRNNPGQSLISQYPSLPESYNKYERILSLATRSGISSETLDTMPVGISWYFANLICLCRLNPPQDWTDKEYELILREDLSSKNGNLAKNTVARTKEITVKEKSSWMDEKNSEVFDGMDNLDDEVVSLLWRHDGRVAEVRSLLKSAVPVKINVQQSAEMSSQDYVEEQEKHLFSISARTMALPVGRGMFTLHTMVPCITEPLQIPKLCLTGKSASTGVTIDFSHIEVAPNMSLWPSFHNGVAAGLRIKPTSSIVDNTWILFNKPKNTPGNNDILPEHAGFLMALGLNGLLTNLQKMNMFEYLTKTHDMISIAIIIGLSAALRGTQNVPMTKILSVHIESLLPPTLVELEVEHQVQIASLLALGLIYMKSGNQYMTDVLLTEIGRPPGPEMDNCNDRESYALSAGFGLGLILLGKGAEMPAATNHITNTLRSYMLGGLKESFFASYKNKSKLPSYQIREGDYVNTDVTSPAATMALALIYFNTHNRCVGEWMKIPETNYLLESVCPDFLLQRTLAYNLIFWDHITPTIDWVDNNVPPSVREFCLKKPKTGWSLPNSDLETMNQAFCNIITGACLSIGLKYAGSLDSDAYNTVHHYCVLLQSLSKKTMGVLIGKATMETAINGTLLSLAMIMAGSGCSELLSLCRDLSCRVCQSMSIPYGSHLATHMALGLTFLGNGRYTLCTTAESVAAMLIAFYPKFPIHSNDNRYHLQAFRHLYVLAVEPRLLIPRDIDTGALLYVDVECTYSKPKLNGYVKFCKKAPCLMPELSLLNKVKVSDKRYWSVVFTKGKNWENLRKILKTSYLDVKQKMGHLPYTETWQKLRNPYELKDDVYFPWNSLAEVVGSYTDLQSWLIKFKELVLEKFPKLEIHTKEELVSCNLLKSALAECVKDDKLYIMPYWLSMIKILQKTHKVPNSYCIWQIKLFIAVVKENIKIVAELPPIPTTVAADDKFNSLATIINDHPFSSTPKRVTCAGIEDSNKCSVIKENATICLSAESVMSRVNNMMDEDDKERKPELHKSDCLNANSKQNNVLKNAANNSKMLNALTEKSINLLEQFDNQTLSKSDNFNRTLVSSNLVYKVESTTKAIVNEHMKRYHLSIESCMNKPRDENQDPQVSQIKSACLTLYDILPKSKYNIAGDNPFNAYSNNAGVIPRKGLIKLLNSAENDEDVFQYL